MSRKSLKQEESFSKEPTIDIHQLSDNARENALKTDLIRDKGLIEGLTQTVDSLLKKLQEKEDEILQLKQMLFTTTPTIGEINVLTVSDEEYIALQQLQKLKDNARLRELTLDEIKKFDLLVKNKRLAQGNATTINADKLAKDLPKDRLMAIAAKKVSKHEE